MGGVPHQRIARVIFDGGQTNNAIEAHFIVESQIPEKLFRWRYENAGLARRDSSERRMANKRIILLSDGTGNSAGNVWRGNVWTTLDAFDLPSSQQIAFLR